MNACDKSATKTKETVKRKLDSMREQMRRRVRACKVRPRGAKQVRDRRGFSLQFVKLQNENTRSGAVYDAFLLNVGFAWLHSS